IEVIGLVGPATGAALRAALAGGKPVVAPAVAPTPPASVSADGWAFPVRGTHNYGNGDNRFGAARSGHSHAGQDVMSPCGTPLAAARGGKVLGADYGGAAGNYIAVHTADTRYDYFYAHMRSAALVPEGATVQTGQIIGYVGDTGDAVGCHLHFELWDGAWWSGGHAVDPLAFLQAWERG
ncbi:MAG: M23 family metallopeptidase, partial [Candidatus Dormibacteraeota bacterium]|nr:M23 family metallopeptidase [Candidatus Dormibacteraeota bacterium]